MNQEWALILLYLIFTASILLCIRFCAQFFLIFDLLAILTVVRYIFSLQYLKKRNMISERDTLFTTGMYQHLFLEIVLIMVIPYPWLQGNLI